jgi:hypothetical protein
MSSSSLADILNPVDEIPVAKASFQEAPVKESSPILAKPVPVPSVAPQNVLSRSTETPSVPVKTLSGTHPPEAAADDSIATEEDMIVDVVGSGEEGTPIGGDIPATIPETRSSATRPNGHPMQLSLSNDSQQTISDIIEIPVETRNSDLRQKSRSPSPSKKRKLTPESSPDPPSKDLDTPETEPIPKDSEVAGQISVEKSQPPARVMKKPRKAPIKKPEAARKKLANGQKKPVHPKRKEKSMSVGGDEVLLLSI